MDYFKTDPIKITHVTVTSNNISEYVYILVGDVSTNIKKEISKKPNKSKLLQKIYGPSWRKKLGFDLSQSGGAKHNKEITEKSDKIVDSNSSSDGDDTSTENKTENVMNVSKSIDSLDLDIKMGDINVEFDLEDLKLVPEDKIITTIKPIIKQKFGIKWVYDISVFQEDKVSEFKEKLFLITNIPIYRQHLWNEHKEHTYSMSYILYQHDIRVYVDINVAIKLFMNKNPANKVEGVPVNMELYGDKDAISVIANDEFRILKDTYEIRGTTHYKIIDANDFLLPIKEILEKMISPNKNQFDLSFEIIYYSFVLKYFPMMTLSVFVEYIMNESLMVDYFPEIAFDAEKKYDMYVCQQHIIKEKNHIVECEKNNISSTIGKKVALVRGRINSSIVDMTLNIFHNALRQELIFIRNLFDEFSTTVYVNFIQACLLHNNQKILFKKIYKKCKDHADKTPLNSIMFKIYLNRETTEHITLILFGNGNYQIKTSWREENNYGFKDIYEIVEKLTNPIIDKINSYGAKVLRHYNIPKITWDNIIFTNISMVLFYKCDVYDESFKMFKDILKIMEKGKIIEERKIDLGILHYYFLKAMYRFDSHRIEKMVNLSNHYEHLTDAAIKTKWDSIFIKCRILRMTKRFSGIKFEINGMRREEYDIFIDYILYILYVFTTSKKKPVETLRIVTKKLTSLKEQDPVLYDFKKKYGSDIIYSKICQKPFQPLLLSKTGYAQLEPEDKKRVLKWMNFTTQEDAYYYCPNPKLPYVRFKINIHPKGYGIPCCQKINISSDLDNPNRIIHDIILKDGVYLKEKKLKTISRYVSTYGKDIEIGRLSKLPEDSLETLFYDVDLVTEEECQTDLRYYLLGVPQHMQNIDYLGYLFCLSNVLDKTIEELISDTINVLKNNPYIFRTLLNGSLNKYFTSQEEFITTIKTIFISKDALSGLIGKDINLKSKSVVNKCFECHFNWWNNTFMDIAKYCFEINTIIFEDKGTDEEISMIIPPALSDINDFIIDSHTNIIVVRKNKTSVFTQSRVQTIVQCYYYPVIMVNKELFFKTNIIDRKLFTNNSSIIHNIKQMMNTDMEKPSHECADLIMVKKFSKYSLSQESKYKAIPRYKICLLYISKSNLCYAVILYTPGAKIYVSICASYYKPGEYELCFKPYLRKNASTCQTFIKFMKNYNYWIAIESDKAGLTLSNISLKRPLTERVTPIYPYIDIDSWIELRNPHKMDKNGLIIGFYCKFLPYYFSPINKSKAIRIKNIQFTLMLYDPDIINDVIFKESPLISDMRCTNIEETIYRHYLYQLLVLEFMDMFNDERNLIVRKKIYTLLNKKNIAKHAKNLKKDIHTIIQNYYRIVYPKDSVLDPKSTGMEIFQDPATEDFKKILEHMSVAVQSRKTSKQLLCDVKQDIYNFDRMTMNKIKSLDKSHIMIELHKIAKKITYIESKISMEKFSFPNVYLSCINYYKLAKNTKIPLPGYCCKQKLRISKKKLSDYLELLAEDLMDPLKERYLFDVAFSEKTRKYLKFTRRAHESIEISFK